jgi:uncharacterized membrane protein
LCCPARPGLFRRHASVAGFGFFTYATYDLTNWAVLKDWTFSISAMDMVWGAVVTGIASLAGYLVMRLVQR